MQLKYEINHVLENNFSLAVVLSHKVLYITRKRDFLNDLGGMGFFFTEIGVLEYSGKIELALRKGCCCRAQTGSLISLAQSRSFIPSPFPLSGVTHFLHLFFSSFSLNWLSPYNQLAHTVMAASPLSQLSG